MNIALGFGVTETEFEQAEETAIMDFIHEVLTEAGDDFVSDESHKVIEKWVKDRAQALRDKSDEYKDAEKYPDRYGWHWPSVLANASDVVVILSFFHINRSHAMSPDGWAALQIKRLVHYSTGDNLS